MYGPDYIKFGQGRNLLIKSCEVVSVVLELRREGLKRNLEGLGKM